MDYKMVAVDLDGTLLDESHDISDAVRQVADEVREAGLVFTIATGRMFQSAVQVAGKLELDVPLVTYNGAYIKCSQSGKIYDHVTIDQEVAQEVLTWMEPYPVEPYAYVNDELYVEKITPRTRHYCQVTKVRVHEVGSMKGFLRDNPTMLLFMGEEKLMDELKPRLALDFLQRLSVTKSFPTFLEMMVGGANKATGLAKLARQLGIRREEIIAVGDNHNDIEMLKYAGVGAAVANAHPDVQAAAYYVAGEGYTQGVLEVVRRFVTGDRA